MDCFVPHDAWRIWGKYFIVNIFYEKYLLFPQQYDELDESPYPSMAKMVFVLFQILIPILLLNMLIAMMGNTYAIVISTADKEFLKQVIDIECICILDK